MGLTRHAIPRTERTLLPAKPSTSSCRRKRGALQGTPHCPRFATNLPMRAPNLSFPRLFTTCPPGLRHIPRYLRPSHTFCGQPVPFAALPRLLWPHAFCDPPASFAALPRLLRYFLCFYALSRPLRRIPRRLRLSHTFCGCSMPVYGLFASLTAIPCLFTPFPRLFTVYPRLLRPVRTFYHPVPFTTTPRRALYGPYCAFYDLSASFAAHLCLLWLSRACLRLLCTFYSPSACVRKGQLPTLPATAFIPQTSRRENGGLCRHPLKGPG